MKSLCTMGLTILSLAAIFSSVAATAAEPKQAPQKKRPPSPALAAITDDPKLPRVLLIGDSISIGYTLATREALAGKANVHRAPTNCGPTIRGLEEIDKWLGDGRWDVIHFNWGLHDLRKSEGKHQVPIDEYEKNLRELVGRMKKTGATLVWCSTTPVPEGCSPPRTNEDVVAYNAVAKKIMDAEGIAIDDLYPFALAQLDKIQRPANVHFTPEGSAVLAKQVAAAILKALEKRQPAKK
ncbi:MAG TPA: SGNH/GDSL hydrolase family protein [Thermoguttaceae bacterium]|nr:SGNH/GDSL hydrolase family protein [Thermoguttaceae bacterium]